MAKVRIPSGLRKSVFERDGFRCLWCGRSSADGVKLHADHVVPESFGGSTSYENLGTLCDQCNLSKGTEYFGNYLLTTIFKVKDIDSKIIHKNQNTGLGKDGKDYDGIWHEFTISFFREINRVFEKVNVSHQYLVSGPLLAALGWDTEDSKIRIDDLKHKELLEFKNKLRDYLFENKGFLEERNGMLIFRERK